jgi:hypothetical protein
VGVTVLAALAMAWVVMCGMGRNPLIMVLDSFYDSNHIAFIGDGFYGWAVFVVGSFAVLLGFKQSAWEVHHSTFYFLLHRPMSRRMVFAIKLVVGASLVAAVLAVAILIYGAWAAVPGHLAAPFDWSMTFDSWILTAMLPLVYLGAFLSGIRPGRWFGTRLIPVVAAVLLVIMVCAIPFWWLQIPLALLGYMGWLVAINYYTQERDY